MKRCKKAAYQVLAEIDLLVHFQHHSRYHFVVVVAVAVPTDVVCDGDGGDDGVDGVPSIHQHANQSQ